MRGISRRLTAVAVLAVALVASAFSFAPIDGWWVGTIQGPEGPGEMTLELRQEGETLTGTIGLFGVLNGPVANGKIAGNDVSFDLVVADMGFTLPFKGKLEGEKLNLMLDTPMGAQNIALQRPPAN
jgi:hypothetical protein